MTSYKAWLEQTFVIEAFVFYCIFMTSSYLLCVLSLVDIIYKKKKKSLLLDPSNTVVHETKTIGSSFEAQMRHPLCHNGEGGGEKYLSVYFS